MIGKKHFIVSICIFLFAAACNNNPITPTCNGSQPTYNSDVKAIVDASCTSSSCHGSSFSTYTGISGIIANENFKNTVLETRDMPKGSRLSQSQLDLLQCWAENGYPEK